MKILTPTVLMYGFTATPTARGPISIDLGIEVDPMTFTPEFVEREMLKYGCRKNADGTWFKSWKWLKEYERNFEAQMGQPVFGPECMDAQKVHLCDPMYRMDLDESGNLIERPRGRLAVWVEPDSQPADLPEGCESVTRQFGAGMDVSEGVEASDSTMEVFCRDNSEQAAELADNRIKPSDLGRFGAAVGRFYNDALLCPVRKMHGLTVLRTLADERGYSNIWHHRIADGIVEKSVQKLGWAKGETSDELLMGRWYDALVGGKVILHSLLAFGQHGQYSYDERGNAVFQKRAFLPRDVQRRHADCVVGCILANQAIRDLPTFKATTRRKLTGIEQEAQKWKNKKSSVWG